MQASAEHEEHLQAPAVVGSSEGGGGDKSGDVDAENENGGDEHEHEEHEAIPNAGWYLSCICEDQKYADTEGCR